jgi:hypothetical protein
VNLKPTPKKVVAAIVVKRVINKLQERKQPTPSRWSRIAPGTAIIALIAGAVAFLAKSGKLQSVIDKVKTASGNNHEVPRDDLHDQTRQHPASV